MGYERFDRIPFHMQKLLRCERSQQLMRSCIQNSGSFTITMDSDELLEVHRLRGCVGNVREVETKRGNALDMRGQGINR